MNFLKVLVSIILLLIVVALLAAGALYLFIDPNKLKPVIIDEVKKRAGYNLTIEGDLTWSFLPRVAIRVDHMTLTIPNETRPFVDMRDIKLATSLSSLMHGTERMQGHVQVTVMRLLNLNAREVSADMHWENNILTINPVKALVYDGSLEGSAHGKDLFVEPKWNWDVQFKDVQLKPLLQDLNGVDSRIQISGLGQVKMQASTQGKERQQMLNHLNGQCVFSMTNGALEGIDLNYFVQAANALIESQPVPSPSGMNQTAFNSLAGTMNIQNGVVNTTDTQLTASAFIAKAQGNIALVNQLIDFQLQINPVTNVKFNWEIPVQITGKLNHPGIRLDTETLKKLVTREEIDKLKSKAVEKIKERIPGKAGEFLQKLLSK